MTSASATRASAAAPLHRVLRWLASTERGASGELVCPEHHIEHTGKSAGALLLAVELMAHGDGGEADALFALARRVALRISSRLEREGDSTCFTFRPGRHDPYNCSNSVIDGGACSDALAAFVMAAGARLPAEEREALTRASVLHAQTYLRYCIVDKGIPAQCAWAMTGAAQAFRLSGHEVLRHACEVGAERLNGIQREDGSVPYHPVEWGAEHPGAADASAFYQSRVHAFTAFALDAVLGPEEAARRDAGFAAGLDFLHGLQGPDGIKTASVEAKPWYWRSAYEVASHPFDVAAFAAEWRRTRAPRAASALAASWRAWLAHVGHDGRPASHVPPPGAGSNATRSYQCAFFWAAHASWMARSLPEIEEALAAEEESPPVHECRVRHFEGADLARLDTPRLCAWVRGSRPPGSAFHGSPAGGLLRVHDRATGKDLFRASPFARRPECAWSGASGVFSPGRGWRAGRDELRFSLWLARHRRRTDGVIAAAREPVRALRTAVIAPASTAVSSAFDRQSSLEVAESGSIRWTAQLADRTGRRVGGEIAHELRVNDAGQLELRVARRGPLPARAAWFRLPAQGRGEVDGDAATVCFGDPRD